MTTAKKTAKAAKKTKKVKKPAKKVTVPLFAARLARLRETQAWSLREVEKRSDHKISRQTVLRAEKGNAELDTVIKLTHLYGVDRSETNSILQLWSQHQLHVAKGIAL